MTIKSIESYIDHTILKSDASLNDISTLCREAIENNFASVCINPCFVPMAKSLLKESDVKVCTVIGFPLGATTSKSKAFEAKEAIENGASEIDMVINIGMLKSGDLEYVKNDIKCVAKECTGKAILKVIIETALLTNEEKISVCNISKEAGADFVKTSTGFSTGGATVEDVMLMKSVVGDKLKVKASGGVRTYEDAEKMIKVGADRIGTSKSINILQESATSSSK